MKLLASLSALLFSGFVAATPVHNIVVFGDSLSDNGNLYEAMKHQLPQSPPYFAGRFSNGPVWIELLIESYFPNDPSPSPHLLNYAYGGAGVSDNDGEDVLFTLKREVDTYLLAHQDKASDDSLFIVWIGANNYLGMPSDAEKTLQIVNAGITKSIKRLVEKGAKHILVLNLPDLGRTPAALEFDSVESMRYFSNHHNSSLNTMLEEFRQTYSDVEWLFFDMNKAFDEVLEHPADYGFTNITGTCYNMISTEENKHSLLKLVSTVKPKATPDVCEGYLFFDLVHPSAWAHKVLATKTRVVLDSFGVELVD